MNRLNVRRLKRVSLPIGILLAAMALAVVAFPRTATNLGAEVAHTVEYGMHIGHDVLAIDGNVHVSHEDLARLAVQMGVQS